VACRGGDILLDVLRVPVREWERCSTSKGVVRLHLCRSMLVSLLKPRANWPNLSMSLVLAMIAGGRDFSLVEEIIDPTVRTYVSLVI
jgi:hypothetical protein